MMYSSPNAVLKGTNGMFAKNLREQTESAIKPITEFVTSDSDTEEYLFMDQMPGIKEWLDEINMSTRKRPVTVEVANPNRKPGEPETITKTVIQSFPALRMTGFALSPKREKGVSLIGEFIRNVKQDEEFSMRFIAPEMRSIERKKFNDQTVMKFVMDCEIAN